MENQSVRERLRGSAFALFESQGFERTTVDEIAARAGVGRTTYFRHFRTKEDVIFPDHDTLLASVAERLAAASPSAGSVAVAEAARLVLRHYLAEGELARSRYRLTRAVPALREREISGQRQYQRAFLDFIRVWLGRSQNAGLRAELMADAVVTAHNHVLRQWLRGSTTTPEADFDRAMDRVLRLFVSGWDRAESETPDTVVMVIRTNRDLVTLVPELERVLSQE